MSGIIEVEENNVKTVILCSLAHNFSHITLIDSGNEKSRVGGLTSTCTSRGDHTLEDKLCR